MPRAPPVTSGTLPLSSKASTEGSLPLGACAVEQREQAPCPLHGVHRTGRPLATFEACRFRRPLATFEACRFEPALGLVLRARPRRLERLSSRFRARPPQLGARASRPAVCPARGRARNRPR